MLLLNIVKSLLPAPPSHPPLYIQQGRTHITRGSFSPWMDIKYLLYYYYYKTFFLWWRRRRRRRRRLWYFHQISHCCCCSYQLSGFYRWLDWTWECYQHQDIIITRYLFCLAFLPHRRRPRLLNKDWDIIPLSWWHLRTTKKHDPHFIGKIFISWEILEK